MLLGALAGPKPPDMGNPAPKMAAHMRGIGVSQSTQRSPMEEEEAIRAPSRSLRGVVGAGHRRACSPAKSVGHRALASQYHTVFVLHAFQSLTQIFPREVTSMSSLFLGHAHGMQRFWARDQTHTTAVTMVGP